MHHCHKAYFDFVLFVEWASKKYKERDRANPHSYNPPPKVFSHINAQSYAHLYTHVHSHTHTYTHIHTHTLAQIHKTMTGHGNIAYPLLERVRAEMAEILQILVTYTSQGSINLHSLPSFIACYRVRGDIRGTVTALRQRYHVLQDQEYRLVLANLTGTDAEQFLKGIRLVIQQIEKVMHSYHASEPPLQAIPRCLVTCYSKVGNVVHAAPLLQRYEALKAQEFEICLADMKGASLDLQDLFAQSQRTDQPASVSGFQASSSSPSSIHSVVAPDSTFQPLTSTNMELPVNDHLPSFEESQSAYS